MINRQELAEELKLRRQIRQAIKIVKEKKKVAVDKVLQEEQTLRNIIRRLINEAEVSDEVPEHSTGINFLKELLTKILPKLEKAYKRLTTSKEQRGSFRAHVVKKIQDMLAPEKVLDQAADDDTVEPEPEALQAIDSSTSTPLEKNNQKKTQLRILESKGWTLRAETQLSRS